MAGKGDRFEFEEFSVESRVLEEIAGLAAAKVRGVERLGGRITGRLSKKSGSGVVASSGDHHIDLDVHLIACYGRPLKETARDVQAAVKEAVESMTNKPVSAVNVFVDGIVFPAEGE